MTHAGNFFCPPFFLFIFFYLFFFQPVQGFDYAKQHLGQQGAEDEVLPVTQETVVLPLAVRDAPASQEREITQDGSTIKTAQSNETRKRYGVTCVCRGLCRNGVHAASCLGKTVRFGTQALCVTDGSSAIYSWRNICLRWMGTIAAKYKIK